MNRILKCRRFLALSFVLFFMIVSGVKAQTDVTGTVRSAADNQALVGVTVQVKGTSNSTATDAKGKYLLRNVSSSDSLLFTYVGFANESVFVGNRKVINIGLDLEASSLDQVVVVGYGTQKKSDITGTVTTIPRERLNTAVNTDVAQAIQGSAPGVMMQTASAGAKPDEVLMIRGRNSIMASNSPLIIIDGIPGDMGDVNTADVQSIEILKDASASAIYGSRAANGVIIITTKTGTEGKVKIQYNGFYSIEKYTNLPGYMNGDQFYDYKMKVCPACMTASEEAIHAAGTWADWTRAVIQNGNRQEHNLSMSGGIKNTHYYFSGSLLDVKGLLVNDKYLRGTSKINLDSKLGNWISIGRCTTLILIH